MDFYARRSVYSPVLGLEEGETRKTCPEGYVKSYLPHFPWSECIPKEQALEPHKFPAAIPRPGPTKATVTPSGTTASAPPPVPPAPPPLPPVAPLPPAPRKARFLKVDHASGELLDPDTGAVIESAYSIDTVDTVAIGAGLGIVAVLLVLAGVFD